MFLTKIPHIDFPNPWTASFAERLIQLIRGSRHVAYFYPRPNMGTFRYRVINMIEALAAADTSIGASWFYSDEVTYFESILARADVIVICHAKYSLAFAQLIAQAHAQGKRVFYDVDDLVFDSRYVHSVLDYLGHSADDADLDYWFADFGRYGALMRLCDGVIVTNDYLAARVREYCDRPAMVVQNFMNRVQLEHSARILDDKRTSGFARDGRIHVGYFSGSPTHRRDFEMIAGALSDLMDQDPRVVLRIVGYLEDRYEFSRFDDRFEVLPIQNILNLQRLVGEVELNLVPLLDNAFTNCKSELKVFEASAVGTISIVSPTFTLRGAIRQGETGFIATSHDWRQTLALAIEQLGNYPNMAIAAAQQALRCFVPEVQGPVVIRVLFGDLLDDPACTLSSLFSSIDTNV